MPMVLCALLLLPLNVRAEGETAGPETTESPAPSATADAGVTAGGPDIAAETAVLIDARSGSVLYQKYAQQKMNPASLVKILSVYLACENLPADSELTASADALSGYDRSASSIWLSEGETAKAVDLEYAAIMASANDANSVLAEAVSQSLDAFTAKMNETVTGWGLSGTQLDNPNGFTSDSEYSTAYDLAMITRQCIRSDAFQTIFSTAGYDMPATNKNANVRQLVTGNQMLQSGAHHYDYATGGKIGWTDAAGYCMVTTALKDGMSLIAVVLKDPAADNMYTDTQALFDYGFTNYKTVTIKGDAIGSKTVEVYSGKKHTATAVFTISKDFNALLPASVDESLLSTDIEVRNEDDADQVQAYVIFQLDGAKVGEAEMDKQLTRYDTSFRATTLPQIETAMDYISAGVLAAFLLMVARRQIRRHFKLPE